MSNLPSNWASIGLLDISTLVRGVTYTKADARDLAFEGSISVLRANNIQDHSFDLRDLVHVPASLVSSTQRIRKGDVVVATSSGSISVVGKAAQASSDMDAGFGAFCGLLRPNDEINAEYFGHYFSSNAYRTAVSTMARGVNINNLKRDHFNALIIPLAPLPEQKRIADKLDAVLARVDACRDHLDRIPSILKRFRQSVLAAATSGKLTEDWRGSYRIEAWSSNKFGDMYALIDGDRGPNYPKQNDYLSDGYCLFLSTKNVRPYGFLFEDQVFVSKEKHEQLRNGTLKIGDVVITTRGTLGNVAIYDHATSISHGVVRINSGMLILREKVQSKIFPEYLKLYIASPMFADQLNKKQTGSAQPQIPSGILKTFDLPVPPVEEQTEIVRRVEALFAFADRLEARHTAARAQVKKLTPATLAKAFRGELVPQDTNDEPAQILLARIAASRSDKTNKKNAVKGR